MTGGLVSSATVCDLGREMKWTLLSLFPDCWVVSASRIPPLGRLPAAALYATEICACSTGLAVRTVAFCSWAVGCSPADDGRRIASNAAGSVGLDADVLKWAKKGGPVER